MIIRKTVSSDIEQILNMYKDIFNTPVSSKEYRWLYERDDYFFSIVAEDNGKIIGHNAIIENRYKFHGRNIITGLSSGGMVYPEYSGTFFQILKKQLTDFSQDIIIAFPNTNSESFFKRIFSFNTIEQNYFTIDNLSELIPENKFQPVKSLFERDNDFITGRLDLHPKNNYEKIENSDCTVYYKRFMETNIDIIYVSDFNSGFYDIIKSFLYKNIKLNIVHWNKEWIESTGFKREKNNCFVYKWNGNSENKQNIFECQMIDSDVF